MYTIFEIKKIAVKEIYSPRVKRANDKYIDTSTVTNVLTINIWLCKNNTNTWKKYYKGLH